MTGPPPQPQARAGVLTRDLWPRLVSGLALAAVAFVLLHLGGWWFALLVMAVALAMSWEWGGIVRGAGVDAILVIHALAVVVAGVLAVVGYAGLGLLAAIVAALVVCVLRFGAAALLSALGVLYTCLPAVVLIWLRDDGRLGFHATLLIILLVSLTDIGAYFAGRLIGGPKLWPQVSPNKTWAGFIGGVVCAALAGALYAGLVPGASALRLALTGGGLGIVAHAGDLAESALKRRRGVKDASALIPGHGGFMDRMDGLVTATIAAGIVALLLGTQSPASGLLLGR
jgi:phosphatidate cytidylyltransferase